MNLDQILSIIRQILTFGGGYVVAKGWVDSPTMLTAVGAIVTLISTGWGLYAHTKAAAIASVNATDGVKVVSDAINAPIVTRAP